MKSAAAPCHQEYRPVCTIPHKRSYSPLGQEAVGARPSRTPKDSPSEWSVQCSSVTNVTLSGRTGSGWVFTLRSSKDCLVHLPPDQTTALSLSVAKDILLPLRINGVLNADHHQHHHHHHGLMSIMLTIFSCWNASENKPHGPKR